MFDYQLALLYRFENQLPLCIGLKAFLKAAWAFMTKPHLNRVQPSRTWFEKEVKEQRLGFTDLVFEVQQRVKNEKQASKTEHELMKFDGMPAIGVDLAVAAAQNYRKLHPQEEFVRLSIV